MPCDVLILRDPRESVKKCSLTPLRGLPAITFLPYHAGRRVDAGRRILLHPDGELLSPADRGEDLLLVDCAWRRVDSLLATVDGTLIHRRLPDLKTAYPRTSRLVPDPSTGLASVEALYAALCILGESRPELLAAYHWRDEFFRLNPGLS
jgi:pre-rRNA-processing protein TSR3